MTLAHWIYLTTYVSIFSFLILERYRNEHSFFVTKRDALYVIIEIITKLVGLTLSLYLMLWIVWIAVPFEIISISTLSVPMYLSVALAFLLVDFFHYISHTMHHKISFLWRFHRLHHADENMDALTTVLHHPFEIASSFIINVSCYVLFDIPVIIIMAHALVAALHAPFSHTKILLPDKLNRVLSTFIITPNFHRLHHSLDMKEGNSNLGTIFPFWDKLFGTFLYKDSEAVRKLKLGIGNKQKPKSMTLSELILNPFRQ